MNLLINSISEYIVLAEKKRLKFKFQKKNRYKEILYKWMLKLHFKPLKFWPKKKMKKLNKRLIQEVQKWNEYLN